MEKPPRRRLEKPIVSDVEAVRKAAIEFEKPHFLEAWEKLVNNTDSNSAVEENFLGQNASFEEFRAVQQSPIEKATVEFPEADCILATNDGKSVSNLYYSPNSLLIQIGVNRELVVQVSRLLEIEFCANPVAVLHVPLHYEPLLIVMGTIYQDYESNMDFLRNIDLPLLFEVTINFFQLDNSSFSGIHHGYPLEHSFLGRCSR
jgi:hypothetical protein